MGVWKRSVFLTSSLRTVRFSSFTRLLLGLWLLPLAAWGQLRIVDYNTAADVRAGTSTIVAAIGAESVNGIVKPPDVFTLQEQVSSATTTQAFVNVLNSIYGAGTYARATLDGGTTGGGHPGLIYNTQTVTLVAQTTASTTSTSGAARQTMRYELRPAGYDDTADFYVYVSHYKASDTSSDAARRNVEAQQVRANADALGSAHIIYTGDFNVYKSSEAMFQTLLAAGNGQAFDPANSVGNWHDNAAYLAVHTQSPATTSAYGGQVLGGIDDRFDFQLTSAEFLDNEGLGYINGSYHTFGNTGTHALNGAITTGSTTALQTRLPGYTTAQTSAVLTALASNSDHLPVVADYQLPAKMAVQVNTVPARVIRDAAVSVNVTVSNVAPVVAANGADELDYALTVAGALSGSATGTDEALGSGQIHAVTLQTGTVGAASGQIEVHSSSQSAANKDFTQSVSYSVLDHARPLFLGHDDETMLMLDLGEVSLGEISDAVLFSIANWTSTLGGTAGLDLDQITLLGDTGKFTLNLSPFTNLAAGGNLQFTTTFVSNQMGNFSATYALLFSDENIPGAAALRTMHLQLTGTAVPEPTTCALLLTVPFLLLRRRARTPRRIAG
jgi:endonuclease/exonuclease/phosphatase family metal-dependent hydrolase